MTNNAGRRKPNGASSIYQGSDGSWHGRVTVGVKDDGKPDRRHVRGKTEAEVTKKVRRLERERDDGTVRATGQGYTVGSWLANWVETIAAPSVRPNTLAGYRTAVYRHLTPGLGAHRLERLTPEQVEKLYARLRRDGNAAGTVHQIHRTLRTALNVAVRRGHIARNVAALAKAPRLDEQEVEPFTVEEAQRLLAVAATRRNGVRFALALSLGLRKGEALGLKWRRIDLERGLIRTPKQLQRHRWEHGCADPHSCGARLHKREACPKDCRRHQRACPPPCPPFCNRHASKCPDRQGGGLQEVDVKSRAGRRSVGIPAPLIVALKEHRAAQAKEREKAADLWQEGDWVFTQANGRPIDPRADHDAWKALLKEAGIRDARLHDARHTAATILLILGVPMRAVMEIMGWSQMSMTTRYQHLNPQLIDGIAGQVAGLLWKTE